MDRFFSGLQRKVSNLLVRGVVRRADSGKKGQALQIQMIASELKNGIEHLEPYGFTSAPHEGAEVFAAFPDGDRSHGVVLVAADRRYRITGLQSGEVCIYTDEGDSITLKRNHVMEIQTKTLTIHADAETIINTENAKIMAATSAEITTPNLTINAAVTVAINSPQTTISGILTVGGNIVGAALIFDATGSMDSIRQTYNGHTHVVGTPNTSTPSAPMG